MIWTIIEFGAAGLLSLAFIFIAAFMVHGIVKAIKGEEILPAEITADEGRKLRELEAAARLAVDALPGTDRDMKLIGVSVALNELDSIRDKAKLSEIERGKDRASER